MSLRLPTLVRAGRREAALLTLSEDVLKSSEIEGEIPLAVDLGLVSGLVDAFANG